MNVLTTLLQDPPRRHREPIPDRYMYGNFDSFALPFTELIEENDLVYNFYLRTRIACLSWGFPVFLGGKQ